MDGRTNGVGMRLKRERLRLGLSQREFGETGGIEANTQGKYENDKRLPRADYLAAISAMGVDVLYVLTGRAASTITDLSSSESMVLTNYRSLAEEDKATISRVVLTISGLLAQGQAPFKNAEFLNCRRAYAAGNGRVDDPAANIRR